MTPAKTIKNLQKGFTLIELLVVIGILAILLAIVLIAINPARQFAQANDTKRASDIHTILNAVNEYMADTSGATPAGLNTTNCPATALCTITSGANAVGNVNLCTPLVTKYLADLPLDPTAGSKTYGAGTTNCTGAGNTYITGYTIGVSTTDNRITVSAVGQITPVITVTR
jgi:prepilin-type N-terminal cleavage/methylation domain-containing protein